MWYCRLSLQREQAAINQHVVKEWCGGLWINALAIFALITITAGCVEDTVAPPLTWDWTVPSGTFVNNTSASDSIPEVTFPGSGDYTVTMRIADGLGGADTTQVTVFLK